MFRVTVVSILLISCCFSANGQHYVTKQYRVANGLPTDLIKGISQDDKGFLWIASDEGLLKYDGIHFKSFPYATHSNYTKGFYRTQKGKLLAVGDLDLLEITNTADSVIFREVLSVSTAVSDTSVSYPKLVYEDHNESMWISESQSVVRLKDRKLRRYNFALVDRTPQFLRSFSFFEDQKGNLFTISVAGHVFRYDLKADVFLPTDYKFPKEVEFAEVQHGLLLIGSAEGLFVSRPTLEGEFDQPKLVSPIPTVSYVAPLPDGNYFVATRGSQHYVVDSTFSNPQIALQNVRNVNHVFLSGEHDIWLSTNEGIVLMQNAPFLGPVGNTELFVECITQDYTSALIYYATALELRSFDLKTHEDRTIIQGEKGSYFQSIVSTPKGIWAANSFRVFLVVGKEIKKIFDFSEQRLFVTRLTTDHNGNIWLTIPGRKDIVMIDKNQNLKTFNVPLGANGFINDVREGEDGIYAASNGSGNYLFYKSVTDTVFHNISIPIDGVSSGDLNAFGLIMKGGTLWLATSKGLVKYDRKRAEIIPLANSHIGEPIRAVSDAGKSELVAATANELYLYNTDTGDYNIFATARNLSGISSRGIFVTRDHKLLIGTVKGFYASSGRLDQKIKTLPPTIVSATVNGKKISTRLESIPFQTWLTMQISSVSFPEGENFYEYRTDGQGEWNRLEGSVISMVTTKSGKHTIQMRARKTGAYTWSDITEAHFFVPTPYWQTVWFYFLLFAAIMLVIAFTIYLARQRHFIKQKELEDKVAERTAQWQAVNTELEAFSYSISHDLRAPLRSIIGFSSILEEDNRASLDEESQKALSTIIRNALKMNQLIDDLLRFSRLQHHSLSTTIVDTSRIVGEIITGITETKDNTVAFDVQHLPSVNADGALIAQVWSNLISNAVKYSARNPKPVVTITVEQKIKEYIFCVRDNGVGFDMQYADKLFGVFQRLHSSREFDGTGIGLALVRSIINRHSGRVWAEAKVNEGAAFYFTLPRKDI